MRRMKNLLKKGTSLMLTFAMLMGLCSTGFATGETKEPLNYVSLGDSMTNGFCFDGYRQSDITIDEFKAGEGVYGEESYANQFAEHLGKTYDVNHAKLAVSALRAEDLLFLLGGREMPEDGWFGQVVNYAAKGDMTQVQAMKDHYQTSIKNADVISLCIGNASFGAFMIDRLMGIMGSFIGSYETEVSLEMGLSLLEDEAAKAIILQYYDELHTALVENAPAELADQLNLEQVCDLISYIAASYLFNYKGVLEKIIELNPDAEIILVGMMNTLQGMNLVVGDMYIPIGEIMAGLFEALNAYIAGLPTAYQLAGQWTEAEFIYAEFTNIQYISQAYPALRDASWKDVEGLSADIVRSRTIEAFNFALRGAYSIAFAGLIGGLDANGDVLVDENGVPQVQLPEVTLEDMKTFALGDTTDAWGCDFNGPAPAVDPGILSNVLYLAFEDALADTAHINDIPLETLLMMTDITSMMGVLDSSVLFEESGLPKAPQAFHDSMVAALNTGAAAPLMKVVNLFLVGFGMSVHPTPATHVTLAEEIIAAYKNGYTAADKTMDDVMEGLDALAALIAEYYDEAYEYGYEYAKNNGYIEAAETALDVAAAELTAIKALVEADSFEMSAEFKAELINEINDAIATIAYAKNLLNNSELNEEALTEALTLLAMLQGNLNNIVELLTIAHDDVAPVVYAELKARVEALNAYVENEVIPAVEKAIREAHEYAVNWLRALVAKLEVALVELKAALVAHVDEKVAAAIACIEAAIAELKAAIENQINMTIEQFQNAVKTAIKDLTTAIVELIRSAQQQGEDWVEAVVNHFVSQIMAIYNNATSSDFFQAEDSYYVAIGDSSVAGYAGLLAEALEIKYEVVDTNALLANAATVAGADLITVGYSNNTMIDYMFAQLKTYLDGKPVAEYDWSKYVTAEGVPYVEQTLADVRAELVAMGLEPIDFFGEPIDVVELIMVAIEAYAYAYVGYMVTYPQMIMGIREINSDALIVSVGMNNALADLAFDLDGTEFAIGEYVQYVVDAANAEAMAFALLTGETIFVDAPAVDTVADISSMTLGALLKKIVISPNPTEDFNASAEGNAYIAEQILKALTVKHVHTEVVLAAVPATCEKTGLTEGLYCSYCGETLIAQEVIPALGHVDEDWDYICDVCGEETCEHDWQVMREIASCDPEGGGTAYICYNCWGYKWVDAEKTAHPGCVYVEQEDPTCNSYGREAHYICTACEAPVNKEDLSDAGWPASIEPLEHKYVDGFCVNPDEYGDPCGQTAIVMYFETETEIAHYGELVEYTVVMTGANELKDGVTGVSFKLNISDYLTLVEIAAGENSGMEATWDSKNKTVTLTGKCTEDEVVLFTFACVVTKNYASAWSNLTSANVTSNWDNRTLNSGEIVIDGYHFECEENAGITLHKIDESTLKIDENGHTFVCAFANDEYDPCDATFTEHYYSSEVEVEPTCTTTGLARYTCFCGHSYVKEIPTVAHVDADKNGYCDVCGAECDEIAAIIFQMAEMLAKYGVDLYDIIDKLEVAVAELREELGVGTDEELDAAIAEVEAAIAKVEAAIEDGTVEAAIAELEAAVLDLVVTAMGKGEDAVEKFVFEIQSICNGAVHGEYVKGEDSYYVAIGDGSITGNSYVDILAAELGVEFNNIGVEGLNVADIAAILAANAEEIAGADLITLGFSNNTMIDYMVAQMKAVLLGGTADEFDWSKYLNKDGVAYVEKTLAAIRAELTALGLEPFALDDETSIDTAEVLLVGVEAYAYAYTSYMVSYPEMINAIRAINSEALIVSVGMNNALANVAFDLNGTEFAIGKYVQYLVDAANVEALALALLDKGVVFVAAPAVETIAEDTNSAVINNLGEFLFNVVLKSTEMFYASADGHAYIAEQILNALTVTEEETDAIDVKMGDLTGDGIVDVADAVKLLKAIAAKTTGEFSVEESIAADLTSDGAIDVADAVKMLKAIASKTTDQL